MKNTGGAQRLSARHWASANEAGAIAGMRLLFLVHRLLGVWPFRLALYPVLVWYVLTRPAARRASAAYLQRIAAFAPVATGMMGVLRHFAAFAETILEKIQLWSGLYDGSRVRVSGAEPVLRQIERGQGALLLCSHFGNLDLCRALAWQKPDLKLTVLVHTRHARKFNAMLAKINPRSQMNILQVTEMTPGMAIMLAEKIGQGELIAIAGDRIPVSPHPRVAYAGFLGQPAPFPVGPYLLANALQCPIYMLFPLRDGETPVLHFELLAQSVSLPRAGRAAALEALAAAYAARLAGYCQAAPLQWFNFYDFWHKPNPVPDRPHLQ